MMKWTRLHFKNPVYEKRLQEIKKKQEIRRKKEYLGIHYFKMYPVKMKCRIHGKKRKERFMKCLDKAMLFNPYIMEEGGRFIDVQWHGVMVGEYEYMENSWAWVLDVTYHPLMGGVNVIEPEEEQGRIC